MTRLPALVNDFRVKRILKEPLLHFLILGGLLFLAFELSGKAGDEVRGDEAIVVSEARIEQLASVFSKTWQRPPSQRELEGLVNDFILEEVYYRRAREMGIDQDDIVIRRRLRQKLEFFTDDAAGLMKPDDTELSSFLADNSDRFRRQSTYTFRQVYINPERHPDGLDEHLARLLASLAAGEEVVGESSLLPGALQAVGEHEVDRTFGRGFAESLDALSLDQWEGPVESGLGVHLVRIEERVTGEVPPLSEVRDKVEAEWANERRLEMREQVNEKLRERYEIVVEWPEMEK